MSELANLAAGPARTSQLSVARELFFVLRASPPWAGRAPRWLCVQGCVSGAPLRLFVAGPRAAEV